MKIAALCIAFGLCLASCGPSALVVPLSIPNLLTPLVREVRIPPRRTHAPIPLVVILDDGPPVDVTLKRPQQKRVSQLASIIEERGYAVWRPLRDMWPPDSILVLCPDKLAAQVHLGLLATEGLTVIDSSRIVLLGFGVGGVIGAMVARRAGEMVHALGFVGTPARSVDRILASPVLRDSVALKRLRRTFDDLRAGAYPDTQMVFYGRADCWRAWLLITGEMPDLVARLPQPVLAIQGTADSLLPLLDIERFRQAIGERPHSAAHNALGVRHDLRDAIPDPKQDENAVSPRLVPLIMNWLEEVAPVPG